MTAYHEALELTKVKDILAHYTRLMPDNAAYIKHYMIQRFGNPGQAIYIDQSNEKQPLILPIYNGQLNIIQYAVMLDGEIVELTTDGETSYHGKAKGFAMYGKLQKNKPVIITYNVEAFFKIAHTNYAVVLVILPNLCKKYQTDLNTFDFEKIQFVINQLSNAGYMHLYLPVRPEHIRHESFQNLELYTAVKLLNHYQPGFECDLSQYDESQQVEICLDESINGLIGQDNWGELIPLSQGQSSIISPYPIHGVPELARGAIEAIAEYVQAPIAMTAQCVIGAMSHIAQAHVNAPAPLSPEGEPSSLFLLTEGQSGSRKTTSRNLAERAIIEYEQTKYQQYLKELEQWKYLQASCDKKDKAAFLINNPPPYDPITRYSDITLESLAGLYIDGIIKNASISSDEAAQFFGGHTMKSDTRNQALGGYAKLFDDGSIERTRSKANLNGSGRAFEVRLTFNLQGQHEVLSDALKDPVLRGQGFLPRFILTIPENLAGTRFQDSFHKENIAYSDQRLIAFWTRCSHLLDECPLPLLSDQITYERRVISMSKEAATVELEFYNEIEKLQAKGQRYEYLQAFASRASQLVRRLATVFAFFEGLETIDRQTLAGACEIIRHSLNEWSRYAEIEAVKENDAEKLIRYLISKSKDEKTSLLNKTISMKGAPQNLRKKAKFNPCLEELIESNYVRLVTVNRSTYIELNPLLLT